MKTINNKIYEFTIFRHLKLLICLTIVLFSGYVHAQDEEFTTQGKDFWLTFMPNYHVNGNSNTDSIFIFITSTVPTSGAINYRNQAGTSFTQNFVINNPNQIYTFKLKDDSYELVGFLVPGQPTSWNQNQTERIAPQSFHITSNDDITVYAHNQAKTTSDAFNVFPTKVLSMDYLVMSYNADTGAGDRTPSQFAIVAVEDNTKITISPTVATYMNRINPFQITLNQGDCYLVQSKIDNFNDNPDLTGTEINADKPIAVFGGHQRASLPYSLANYSASRDCLVEQMQPFKYWGKNAFIIPFIQPLSINSSGDDLFRVLAAYDTTEVTINGNIFILNKSGLYESPVGLTPSVIKANKPISVFQYKKSSGEGSQDPYPISDPFMLLIPPKEQYIKTCRIINAQAWENKKKIYTAQYITIIVADTSIYSVKLDNGTVVPSRFRPIQNSGYSYANLSVTDGTHLVSAFSTMGVYVYGYGEANSYGYLGGMTFIPINYKAPKITSIDSCYSVLGLVERSSDKDLRILSVTADSVVNTDITIPAFTPLVESVQFNATLKDTRKDGQFIINTADSLDNKSNMKFNIPGFTIGQYQTQNQELSYTITDTMRSGGKYCFLLKLINYGKFSHTIKPPKFNNILNFTRSINSDFTMAPGNKIDIDICITLNTDTTITDTLFISDDCSNVNIVILNLTTVSDRKSPNIAIVNGPCDSVNAISITDSAKIDSGIFSITTEETVNCTLTNVASSPKVFNYILNVIDPTKDAIIAFIAVDSMNNRISYRDTIPGYTLSISTGGDNNDNLIDFSRTPIGHFVCDSFRIENYGIRTIIFDNIALSRNIEFSIPQHQLPLVLNPGDIKYISVCFRPTTVTKKVLEDSLVLPFKCISSKLRLSGLATELLRDGNSACDIEMLLTTKKAPKSFFLDNVYPNPVNQLASVNIGLSEESITDIKIFNTYGQLKSEAYQAILKAGIYKIDIDVTSLLQGSYLLVLSTNQGIYTKQFQIIK
jgi:hypothetical protein